VLRGVVGQSKSRILFADDCRRTRRRLEGQATPPSVSRSLLPARAALPSLMYSRLTRTGADIVGRLKNAYWRTSAPRDRKTGFMEYLNRDCPCQSALMPTNFTTLPHFSVSSAMNLPKSAGEPASAVPPRPASRAFILGSARAALTSLLSLSTISAGVFLGAPMPCHELAS